MNLTLQVSGEFYFDIDTVSVEFETVNSEISYNSLISPEGWEGTFPCYLNPYEIILKPKYIYLVYGVRSGGNIQNLKTFLSYDSAKKFIDKTITTDDNYEYNNQYFDSLIIEKIDVE